MVFRALVMLLVLIPPMTAVIIITFVQLPPRLRSTLALGTMFLLASLVMTILGMGSALIEGRQPFWPYLLMTGLPTGVILKMMHMELTAFLPHKKNQPDVVSG